MGVGMMLSAVTGVISAIFSYIYMNYIDTDMMGASWTRCGAT